MHWFYGYSPGWGAMLSMTLWMVLLIGGATAIAVVLLRSRRDNPADRILDERLAKGEIDAEEHERLRRALHSS